MQVFIAAKPSGSEDGEGAGEPEGIRLFSQLELKKHRDLVPEVVGRKITGEKPEANDDASQNAHLNRRKARPGVLFGPVLRA